MVSLPLIHLIQSSELGAPARIHLLVATIVRCVPDADRLDRESHALVARRAHLEQAAVGPAG